MSQHQDKYWFLKAPAPPSYVAGLGRGASGFTTRSDIGPAREVSSTDAGVGREDAEGDDGDQFKNPEEEGGLFAGMVYDRDDEEADAVYDQVQKKMEERRKSQREQREALEAEEYLKNNPRIQDRFSDLKRGLSDVSDEQWENLPDVSNFTGKRRKKQVGLNKSYVVPDSVLLSGREKNMQEASLDAKQMEGGYETPAEDGTMTDFTQIGDAQTKVLSLKLDKLNQQQQGSAASSSSSSGSGGGASAANGSSTTVDPKGYLTDLDSVVHKTEAEIGDTKRGRMLLQSLTKSNKKHAPGWIAAARLEEVAGKMVAARKIIQEGCENCPKSEEVWREAARLNTQENAKIILANAVQNLPQSVNIWLDATDLEQETSAKKRVLRKALEFVPNSVKLWRKTVNLEDDPADARVLLARAVEVVPLSVELWLALARIEKPEKARGVLNKARKAIPTSHEIWIAAARLVEQEGQLKQEDYADQVDKVMAAGVNSLKNNGVELKREEWLTEAVKCEAQGSILTAQALVNATIAFGVDEDARLETWMDDAQNALSQNKVHIARAIYSFALRAFPTRESLWRKAADLEREYGDKEALLGVLSQAVQNCPHAEVLWLIAAKESWLGGDVPAAREILEEAFKANPESEQIWLAACKLEAENGELKTARQLMERARKVAGTDRIWIKSAVFERLHGTTDDALDIVNQGLALYPTADKLYMIKGQILQSNGNTSGAREAFSTGTKKCPESIPLWLLASRLEENAGMAIRSRALLERARALNPRTDELWLEAVRIEQRQGSPQQAKSLMAKALQECPSSGLLWSESVWMEDRAARKTKSVDALKKSSNDPRVIVVVARMFWAERNIAKARGWFEKAAAVNPDLGDTWAWWLKFERQHGSEADQQKLVARCATADPHHGMVWQDVLKHPDNSSKSTAEVLALTADRLA